MNNKYPIAVFITGFARVRSVLRMQPPSWATKSPKSPNRGGPITAQGAATRATATRRGTLGGWPQRELAELKASSPGGPHRGRNERPSISVSATGEQLDHVPLDRCASSSCPGLRNIRVAHIAPPWALIVPPRWGFVLACCHASVSLQQVAFSRHWLLSSPEPRGRRSRRRDRRGITLILAILCLAVSAMLLANLTRMVRLDGQNRVSHQHALQAEWLAHYAWKHAVNRLAADPTYNGGSWELTMPAHPTAGRTITNNNGRITVSLQRDQQPTTVTVVAQYPIDAPKQVTRTMTRSLTLATSPE